MGNQLQGEQNQIVQTIVQQNLPKQTIDENPSSTRLLNTLRKDSSLSKTQYVNYPQTMESTQKFQRKYESPPIQNRNNFIQRFPILDDSRRREVIESSVQDYSRSLKRSASIIQQKDMALSNFQREIQQQRKIIEDQKNQANSLSFSNSMLDNRVRYLQSALEGLQNDKKVLSFELKTSSDKIQSAELKLLEVNHKVRDLEIDLVKERQKTDFSFQKLEQKQKLINESFGRNSNLQKQLNKQIFANHQLKEEISSKNVQLHSLQELYEIQKEEMIEKDKKLSDLNEKFQEAKEIGQSQIDFLAKKAEEYEGQIARLKEENQLIKKITVERNRIFERKIIYDLKGQNEKLWNKLIQLSENEVKENSETKRDHFHQKNKQKGQYIQRYEEFMKNLTTESSIIKDEKVIQNVQFYKERCFQLEQMVDSHIQLNKQLKNQLQSFKRQNGNSVLSLQIEYLKGEIEKEKTSNKKLSQKLSQFFNKEKVYEEKIKMMEQKLYELSEHNHQIFYSFENLSKKMQQTKQNIRKLKYEILQMQTAFKREQNQSQIVQKQCEKLLKTCNVIDTLINQG